jgi:predicted RNA-binding Zn ribbon-like protein
MPFGELAPQDLSLVEEFVNSHHVHPTEPGGPHSIDEMSDPAGLGEWLDKHGLGQATRPTRRDQQEAVAVREALRSLLLTNNGKDLDPAALRTLNEASGVARFALGFEGASNVTITPQAAGVRGVIGHILSIVADAMADESWGRFKACLNDECQVAFYDYARNQSRKWCAMETCGNRAKARAYRRRQGSSANG